MIDPTLPPHDWLRQFLEKETGNAGTERTASAIDTRLRTQIAAAGSLSDLVRQLRLSSRTDPLRTEVLSALLNNETSFFRDPHCFDGLRDFVLPSLIAARKTSRQLTIWCAACSSGQEPYSLAMLIHEAFPLEAAHWRIQIRATDASAMMIDRVAAGRYSSLELARGLTDRLRERWFNAEGKQATIQPELRRMVKPQALNLVEPWPVLPKFDLVLLRNVMIYMKPETRAKILARLHPQLAPGGALVLGGPESLLDNSQFTRETHGRLRVYRPR